MQISFVDMYFEELRVSALSLEFYFIFSYFALE